MKRRPKLDHYVNVLDLETRHVLKQLGPFGSRRFASRAETGIQRTLDIKTQFTMVTTKREPEA